MKPKNRSLIVILFSGGMALTMFQNCAKAPSTTEFANPSLNKTSESAVIATDSQGRLLPVQVQSPESVLANQNPSSAPSAGVVGADDRNVVQVEAEKSPDEDMGAACGLSPLSIQQVVDLAQFKGQDVKLDLIEGKTLLYSSDPQFELSSLAINADVGRAVLCGAKVLKLDLRKGLLEIYASEIKEIGERTGRFLKDPSSLLPADL